MPHPDTTGHPPLVLPIPLAVAPTTVHPLTTADPHTTLRQTTTGPHTALRPAAVPPSAVHPAAATQALVDLPTVVHPAPAAALPARLIVAADGNQ